MCFIHEENHLKRLNAVLHWQDVIELTHDSVQDECNSEYLGIVIVTELLKVNNMGTGQPSIKRSGSIRCCK